MTEPEGDDAQIHSAPEQRHGRGVAQCMGLDVLRGERGAGAARRAGMS